MFVGMRWFPVRDGDERSYFLHKSHYSHYEYSDNRRQVGYRNRFLIFGPGEKLPLLTVDGLAAFGWLLFDGPLDGLYCSYFINRGPHLSSDLIFEAEQLARVRWPFVERFYTFVDSGSVLSPNPGYCFKCAGWQFAGYTKIHRRHILIKVIN